VALGEYPGVYAVFCKATGLPYIGSSVNMHVRTFQHISALRRHRHESKKLQDVWKTYGEDNFDIVILEVCPKELLFEREQFYIDACITEVAKFTKIAPKTLYRLASQGDIACIRIGRNVRFTQEMIDRIRQGGTQ
jgi:excisionase family DNA binding protein